MEKTILGRTGLKVTAAGLGCGGFSKLGLAAGEGNACRIIKDAFDAGVNFFDTAALYGTQQVVGKALNGIRREEYIISSKFPYFEGRTIRNAEELEKCVDQSLIELNTDYIDVYHLHGVLPQVYSRVRDVFYPELRKMQQKGKIRYIGITELFGIDNSHEALKLALADDLWDVIMAGYSIINPSAAKTVLPTAKSQNVGTIGMFAVRSSLSDPESLMLDVRKMIEAHQADEQLVKEEDTLKFLTDNNYAASVVDAAYRFCRHSEGIDVTLTGTGNTDHLASNLKSLSSPPLPKEALDRLEEMFGRVDCVSGQQQFPEM